MQFQSHVHIDGIERMKMVKMLTDVFSLTLLERIYASPRPQRAKQTIVTDFFILHLVFFASKKVVDVIESIKLSPDFSSSSSTIVVCTRQSSCYSLYLYYYCLSSLIVYTYQLNSMVRTCLYLC